MTSRSELRAMALDMLAELGDGDRALASLSHLLDKNGGDEVRQILALMSEITLQITPERFQATMMIPDAIEGIGQILRSCQETLEIIEENREADQRAILVGSPKEVTQA